MPGILSNIDFIRFLFILLSKTETHNLVQMQRKTTKLWKVVNLKKSTKIAELLKIYGK